MYGAALYVQCPSLLYRDRVGLNFERQKAGPGLFFSSTGSGFKSHSDPLFLFFENIVHKLEICV